MTSPIVLNSIAVRFATVLACAVEPLEDVAPFPGDVFAIDGVVHCEMVSTVERVEDAIRMIAKEAQKSRIKCFYRLPAISIELGINWAACEGFRVFVRVRQQPWRDGDLVTLEYLWHKNMTRRYCDICDNEIPATERSYRVRLEVIKQDSQIHTEIIRDACYNCTKTAKPLIKAFADYESKSSKLS